jgi:hypothetical protein
VITEHWAKIGHVSKKYEQASADNSLCTLSQWYVDFCFCTPDSSSAIRSSTSVSILQFLEHIEHRERTLEYIVDLKP